MAQCVWSVMTARRRGSGNSASSVEPVWPSNVTKISFVFFETSSGTLEVYGFNQTTSTCTSLWKWSTNTNDCDAVLAYLATLIATGPGDGPSPPPGYPPGYCSSVPQACIDAAVRAGDGVP